MARTITWDELRDLAVFEAQKGCAISLYLNLHPSVTPTAGDAGSRLRSLLDSGARAEGADRRDLGHDQKLALKADFERIREFYEREFDREGAHGLAVFSAGLDNVWRPLPLTEAVPDRVKVGRQLHLAPLVPLVGRGEGALVIAVGRERGDVYRLRGGRLEEIAEQFDEQPGRHDQGGWSQARFQRHIEKLVEEHLRDVAENVDRLVRRLGGPKIVVVAADETRAEFGDLLSAGTKAAIIGWAHAEAHAQAPGLLAQALPVLERWRAEQEGELLDRWREEAGRNGRAARGWTETLAAASDARVDVLLVQDGAERAAFRCPACGRVSAEGGKCPLDGTTFEESSDGLDLAVHQTLANGGTVWAVHGRDLDPVEGIGALLRY
jgi:peptide chain release factor subunit 1